MSNPLLSVQQIRDMEEQLFASGVGSYALMCKAGEAVAHVINERYDNARPVMVLAGTGNNGGDGFVVAKLLNAQGYNVTVALYGDRSALKANVGRASSDYTGEVMVLTPETDFSHNPVIVDALWGTGASRPLQPEAVAIIRTVNNTCTDIVSVDLPSGVESDTGAILGEAVRARITVTFGYKKYAHLLLPARSYCGEVIVANIGFPAETNAQVWENNPDLWVHDLKWPLPEGHKYQRGHVVVMGGPASHAGAAKMAGYAALRIGAGLVTIACNAQDIAVYASTALSLITQTTQEWPRLLADARVNTVLIGPGAGINEVTQAHVLEGLGATKSMVIDADALTIFATEPEQLWSNIKSPVILTPHAGEFARIFPAIAGRGSKLQQALEAAALSGAVVIYKGYDTVIAAPDGRAVINGNAPANLATAGSGDVLAGIAAGLLAQGMDTFMAAQAAVYMHAQAALLQPTGLIAEDILAYLPQVLSYYTPTK